MGFRLLCYGVWWFCYGSSWFSYGVFVVFLRVFVASSRSSSFPRGASLEGGGIGVVTERMVLLLPFPLGQVTRTRLRERENPDGLLPVGAEGGLRAGSILPAGGWVVPLLWTDGTGPAPENEGKRGEKKKRRFRAGWEWTLVHSLRRVFMGHASRQDDQNLGGGCWSFRFFPFFQRREGKRRGRAPNQGPITHHRRDRREGMESREKRRRQTHGRSSPSPPPLTRWRTNPLRDFHLRRMDYRDSPLRWR